MSCVQQHFSLSSLDRGGEVHAGDGQVAAPACFKENVFWTKSHLSPVLSDPQDQVCGEFLGHPFVLQQFFLILKFV